MTTTISFKKVPSVRRRFNISAIAALVVASSGDPTGPPAIASITGGTGVYRGARGSVAANRLNSCQPGADPCRTQDVFKLAR